MGLLLPNGPELIAFWLGAALLGAVAVPFNARYRPRELAYVVRQSRVRVLVTASSEDPHIDLAGRARQALTETAAEHTTSPVHVEETAHLEHLLVLEARRGDRLEEVLQRLAVGAEATMPELPAVDASDTTLLMYTSGTTAEPKGCLLSHGTLLRAGRAMVERYRLTAGDRLWNPLPMFHLSALHPFVGCLSSGCTFLSMTRFEPDVAAAQVLSERVDILYPAFATLVNDLLASRSFTPGALTRLRRINCVAPPDGLRRLQQRFPQSAVTSVYGLTEAGGVIAYGDADEPLETRIGTCGRPFEGIEVRIAPLADEQVSGGEAVGEIQLRGWCLFSGYFDQPQATRDALTPDGWLHTGDLGSIDGQGRLRYHGRLKDMLKVGGENVSALEIESTLMRHPGVKLAQVVGKASERYGEVPVAFVELAAGVDTSSAALIAWCRRELARFKVPAEIHTVTEWPMSATKIQKHRLRERLSPGTAGE